MPLNSSLTLNGRQKRWSFDLLLALSAAALAAQAQAADIRTLNLNDVHIETVEEAQAQEPAEEGGE